MSFRDRLQSAPVWVPGLISGLLFGALFFVVELLIVGDGRSSTLPLAIGSLFGGLVFGVAMTLLLRRQRRQFGGTTLAAAVGRALKSGELPADAEAAEWRPVLDRTRSQAQRQGRWGWLFFLFVAAAELCVGLVLAGQAAWFFVAAAVVFAGFAVWTPFVWRRQLRRVAVLERQLDEGAPRDGQLSK